MHAKRGRGPRCLPKAVPHSRQGSMPLRDMPQSPTNPFEDDGDDDPSSHSRTVFISSGPTHWWRLAIAKAIARAEGSKKPMVTF